MPFTATINSHTHTIALQFLEFCRNRCRNDHYPNDDYRSYGKLRLYQQADPDKLCDLVYADRSSLSNRTYSFVVYEPDAMEIESIIAPLHQCCPITRGLLYSAAPIISPWVSGGALEIGDSRFITCIDLSRACGDPILLVCGTTECELGHKDQTELRHDPPSFNRSQRPARYQSVPDGGRLLWAWAPLRILLPTSSALARPVLYCSCDSANSARSLSLPDPWQPLLRWA